MYHRTDGLKPFNFKSPYVCASWILAIVSFFVGREIFGPVRRGSWEHLLIGLIVGICILIPIAWAYFLDYREVPEGTKVSDDEKESLLDFLDERNDLK